MNCRSLVIIAASAFIFTAACGKTSTTPPGDIKTASTPSATPDEFAAARVSFKKNCVSCHGEKGNGGPVKLDDGTKLKVPSLREGHALHHPNSDFVKQITKGGDGMPAFGEKLKPEEITDLVRLIRHDFQAGVTPPDEPAKDAKPK